jgi:hypothetical protein
LDNASPLLRFASGALSFGYQNRVRFGAFRFDFLLRLFLHKPGGVVAVIEWV